MFGRFMFQHLNEEDPRHCGPWRHGRHFARFGGGRPEFFEGFGGRERGFGGARERLFDGGELQLFILQLLSEKPSYGYELIKALEERMAGGYAPSPGVIYPTLTMLEEKGFAEQQPSEAGKKVYAVTEAGRKELADNADRLRAVTERIEQSGRRFGRGRSPQIMRAFHNLGEAVRIRMHREPGLTDEQIAKIAEAIDAAARAVDAV